ncbi:MAG: cbb3-type cytochrome c oxidase subunit I [Acidimicrobiia bacterium]
MIDDRPDDAPEPSAALATFAARIDAMPDGAVQRRYSLWQIYLSFVGLALGGAIGTLQAFDRAGHDFYESVGLNSYYQGLSIHGVALAIVFTFTFSNGWLQYATMRGFNRPLGQTWLVKASFWLSAVGIALATFALLADEATVLYTMYAPLQASWMYYLGAALLVVGTWAVLANQLVTLRAWRKDNPGERIPLISYASIATYLMWGLASIGIAVEVLVFLLPWSLGLIDGVDPLLTRTLFWFTGHPIVYFWLLPAYVAWYLVVPKRAGGRLFSDPVVRVVFIMFLLLSTPVGLHHQFTDPGVDEGLKFVHGLLTFAVFFPSVITAFTLMAALEEGGRKKGGKGLLGWIPRLPWKDPLAATNILAMITFLFGGMSGLINASATVNKVVHNTSFVPGHFHMTVGSAVALSFMGIAYWLVPHMTGKRLFSDRLALVQAWLYAGGVLVFGRGLMVSGLNGQPRRVPINQATYGNASWFEGDSLAAIGGFMMVIAGAMFFYNLIRTMASRQPARVHELEFETSDSIVPASEGPAILDSLGFWFIIAVVLVALAYTPAFIIQGFDPTSPTWQPW